MTKEVGQEVYLFSKDTVADTMKYLSGYDREESMQYGLDLILLGLMQLQAYSVGKEWLMGQYPTQIQLSKEIVDFLIETDLNKKG